MNCFSWRVLFVGCLLAAWGSAAQAGDSTSGQPGAATPRTLPPMRMEVVLRNLWDILWDNAPDRVVTGQTHYDWKWLASRYDRNGNGIVSREEFPGSSDSFARLDRNWDGRLTREDLDWKPKGVLGRQKATTFALFKSIDKSSDGRITPDEWQAAFSKLASDKGYLNDQELEELIYLPAVQKGQRERKMFGERSQAGLKRLERLFASGKLFTDGPEPGELAPDFVLRTPDGKTSVRLSSYRGKKPVVLIFGSFT